MGASAWIYFVPYQPDINKALQALREEVFRSGKYFKMQHSAWDDDNITVPLPPELIDALREEANYYASLPEPKSPDELLHYNAAAGTHSIIDITRVSTSPEFGSASPLTPQELFTIFGTEKPTRAVIDKIGENQLFTHVTELRQRWEGAYIIVYKDEQPDEILFIGFSGD